MDSAAMGRKGGLRGTEAQQFARRRNILQALAKRHPNSPKIRQELERLWVAEAKARSGKEP